MCMVLGAGMLLFINLIIKLHSCISLKTMRISTSTFENQVLSNYFDIEEYHY